MPQFIVNVDRLNKRNAVPESFSDKSSVIGVVNFGFRFEGEEVVGVPNAAPGPWYKDRDNSVYWGGGLKLVPVVAAPVAAPAAPVAPVAPGAAPGPAAPAALTIDGKKTFQWLSDLKIDTIWNDPNGTRGQGVTIAVLDTGYNFANNDIAASVTGVGMVGLQPPIKPDDIRNPKIRDSLGHGTYCAGIASARNSQDFVVGVAPASKLIVIKICEDGAFDQNGLEVMINGIEMAIDQGAEVISISHCMFPKDLPETPGYIDSMQQKLDAILAGKNVLIFAACGNNNFPRFIMHSEVYPASLTGCLSVGATDGGQLSPITVLSEKTIIHAQGVNVESYLLGADPVPQSGTSASTPIVAGIAALAVSKLKKKNGGWSASDLRKIIEDGDPIENGGGRKLINPTKIFEQL